MWQG
jgi:hypothetical protein